MGNERDDSDLEALAPLDDAETSPARRRLGSRAWLVLALIPFVAIIVAAGLMTVQVNDLRDRVHQLETVPASTTTTSNARTVHRYCLSFPLVGAVEYTPGSFDTPGYIGGDIGGLPPKSYVRMELWDTGPTPARLVYQTEFQSNENGAQHTGEPMLTGSQQISRIYFSVGATELDARRYGRPAFPC